MGVSGVPAERINLDRGLQEKEERRREVAFYLSKQLTVMATFGQRVPTGEKRGGAWSSLRRVVRPGRVAKEVESVGEIVLGACASVADYLAMPTEISRLKAVADVEVALELKEDDACPEPVRRNLLQIHNVLGAVSEEDVGIIGVAGSRS